MPHPIPDSESADQRFARAMAAADAYRNRRDPSVGEGLEEWLSAREDLRELLEPMLEADEAVTKASPTAATGDGAATETSTLRHFAHFRILGALGGGGMGDVYLAKDEILGRKVALKMIRPEALWSQDAKLRFHREALAVGQLDHPNICKLYEAGEHDGWPFMALQHIAGETLAQKIEQNRAERSVRGKASTASAPTTRADITEVVALIEQVARALHHAHEHGLVHRDIKPGNIMIGDDGQPVVLDFGLVRDVADLEASLASSRRGVGTPLYMSPEQIRRTGRVDARTDVYSLGVTLYECLTHERPFDGTTEAELADCILANHYPDPRAHNRQLPPELSLVIACALDCDPERRYRTALAMAEDLRRVLLLQPVHARPVGTVLRLRRWAQRNPTLLGVGSVAGIAVLSLVFAVNSAIEASAQQGIATARAEEASSNLGMYNLLSDVVQIEDCKAIERTLYPAVPEKAPAMRSWLREHGEPLAQRLPTLEAALVELQHRDPDDEDRFLREKLSKLVEDLRAFVGEKGELAGVRRRLLHAESVYGETIENHRAAWERAILAIAQSDGKTASRLYDHLVLTPQLGLVPIGMDPTSRLWEFAHLASGAIAQRDPQQGRLVIAGETGIVFVLLPGCTFAMGAQKENPDGRNYDPGTSAVEGPVHDVTLGPFLLSKYEMTQGQWERLTGGERPSEFKMGMPVRDGMVTLRYPVENVDWNRCDRLMMEQGLALPTESQWEYGCRAGTTTPWWGDGMQEGPSMPKPAPPPPKPEFPVVAPVDSFAPNGFGLCATSSNLLEWCRDRWGDYPGSIQPGDGLRISDSETRTFRGNHAAGRGHSAGRGSIAPTYRCFNLGLRPARILTQ